MTKYRIVKEVDRFHTVYRVQYRFLWLFWVNVYEKELYFSTLEAAIEEVKFLNNKTIKKVVYEE